MLLVWPHEERSQGFILGTDVRMYLDAKYNLIFRYVALFELLVWPHEVEPWFHSWYRGRVET